MSEAVTKLLAAADEVLGWATALRDHGRDADCLACALFAAEYLRAARAMQEMEDASAALQRSANRA